MPKIILIISSLIFQIGCSTSSTVSFESCMGSDSASYEVSDVMGSAEEIGHESFKKELREYCSFLVSN